MKTAATFIAEAHAEYTAAVAAHKEIPFSFGSALQRPEPPVETPEARAGAMVAEMGLTRALAACVGMGLMNDFANESTGNFWRLVAMYVVNVATEAQDA